MKAKPLSYRGAAAGWKALFGRHEDWTAQPAYKLRKVDEVPIKQLMCPSCASTVVTTNMKLKRGAHFSNLTCQKCLEVTSSKTWHCMCGQKWIKCHLHAWKAVTSTGSATTRRGKRLVSERGIDAPLPTSRKTVSYTDCIAIDQAPRQYIALPPGSKLAMKFPHLVKSAPH